VTEKNRNLMLRVGSAVVLLPVVLWLLAQGGFYTAALLGFAAAACTYEYLSITLKQLEPISWATVALSALMPAVVAWRPADATALISGATGVVLFSAWVWHLLNGPLQEGPQRAAHLLTAFIYGHGGLTALMAMRDKSDGIWWVVAALVITWGNDTAAYFFGRFLGKNKLYPEVSPSKSWEGFFGGFVGAIGIMFIVKQFFAPFLTVTDCVFLGTCGSLLGPAGDLCESMLKRAYAVKDSGNIIPGHGGMLDRVDALIFNAPMVLLYVQFMRPNLVG
jgi:phosphatidate cytidylyltransferase